MDYPLFIAYMIVGAMAGWLFTIVMARRDALLSIVVGILGAGCAGLMFMIIADPKPARPWSIFIAFIGAVVMLGLYQLFVGDMPVVD